MENTPPIGSCPEKRQEFYLKPFPLILRAWKLQRFFALLGANRWIKAQTQLQKSCPPREPSKTQCFISPSEPLKRTHGLSAAIFKRGRLQSMDMLLSRIG